MHYLSVPYYVLGGALRLVIAQDLVRKLCPECRRARAIQPHERVLFEQAEITAPETLYDAVGCDRCFGYGYRGRTGVFQVAAIDDELGDWLARGPRQQEIRERLAASGSRPLAADALSKAAQGATSIQEVLQPHGKVSDSSPVV